MENSFIQTNAKPCESKAKPECCDQREDGNTRTTDTEALPTWPGAHYKEQNTKSVHQSQSFQWFHFHGNDGEPLDTEQSHSWDAMRRIFSEHANIHRGELISVQSSWLMHVASLRSKQIKLLQNSLYMRGFERHVENDSTDELIWEISHQKRENNLALFYCSKRSYNNSSIRFSFNINDATAKFW